MNDRVYQRALHVVGEIERCTSTEQAISNEDYETVGRLMYQSHVSLRYRSNKNECNCPVF
jgi:galactokinase